MNFDPIPEHEMLRESVREFFARELPEERIREMDRARRIPREIWKRFAALGWTGLYLLPADLATVVVNPNPCPGRGPGGRERSAHRG